MKTNADILKLKKDLNNKKQQRRAKLDRQTLSQIVDNIETLSRPALLKIVDGYKLSLKNLEDELSIDNYIETVQIIKKQL